MKKNMLIIALLGLGISNCETAGKRTAAGTAIGAGAGAAVGAIVGHQSGNRTKGALIGGAVGAALGGTIGYKLDKQAKELAAVAETKRTEHGIVTQLKGDILFATGKSNLTADAQTRIGQLGKILAKYPEDEITVTGHTDNVGSLALNQSLSEQRAEAVRGELIKHGVPQDKIKSIGVGPTQPMVDNSTPTNRARNRRVELHISMPETTHQS